MTEEKKYAIKTTHNGENVAIGSLVFSPDVGGNYKDDLLTFQYDLDSWVRKGGFQIDPELPLSDMPHNVLAEQPWGFLRDMGPDGWGQRLQDEAAKIEGRYGLSPMDYIVGVSDFMRMGAYRLCDESGQYVNPHNDVPTLASLEELQKAVDGVEGQPTREQIEMLLFAGSSVGGAQPKAVVESDEKLYIAKFQSSRATEKLGSWEATMMELAKKAGIQTSNYLLLGKDTDRPIFLSERFDRSGEGRIPFMSAATAMQTRKNRGNRSYIGLMSEISTFSVQPKQDVLELWQRMTFNALAGNFDDHLNNHGFIREQKGWRLSPAYDLNPSLQRDYENRFHMLPFVDTVNKPSAAGIDLMIDIADRVHIDPTLRDQSLKNIVYAIGGWRSIAKNNGLDHSAIERHAGNFEHRGLEQAQAVVNTSKTNTFSLSTSFFKRGA